MTNLYKANISTTTRLQGLHQPSSRPKGAWGRNLPMTVSLRTSPLIGPPVFEREQTSTQATNRPPRPPCGLPRHHNTASGPPPSRPPIPRRPGAEIFPTASRFGQRPPSVHNEDPPSPRGPSPPPPLPPRGTTPRARRARANRAALTCVRYHEETLSSSPRKTTRRPARDVGRASGRLRRRTAALLLTPQDNMGRASCVRDHST